MELAVILAASTNDVIGKGNDLPWHIGADLRRFKKLTMGHPIVMGRKTFESIGRVLAGRPHVVVSRNLGWRPDESLDGVDRVFRVDSWDAAKLLLEQWEVEKAFVIGGAQLFTGAIDDVSHFYLTRVLAEVQGDVYLPQVDWKQWRLVQREVHPADEKNDHDYAFEDYLKVS